MQFCTAQKAILGNGTFLTAQLKIPAAWIHAFLSLQSGQITRVFTTDTYFRRGMKIDIITDASPFRMGACFVINGSCKYYFADGATHQDCEMMGIAKANDSTVQQAYEALTILVALRL